MLYYNYNKTKEIKKVKEKVQTLENALQEISLAWEENAQVFDSVNEFYPFNEDLETIILKVEAWKHKIGE